MMFVSGPRSGSADGHQDRVSAIEASCRFLGSYTGPDGEPVVRLAQALPEPQETWSVEAFVGAGFTTIGTLSYLRRPIRAAAAPEAPQWPAGVEVRVVQGVGPGDPDRAALIRALERTYEATLDCPGLCGLRETEDVLESHRATGAFDRALWRLVLFNGEPHGCMLLNRCPEQGTVELVYLGLSPALRGRRIGSKLLESGLALLAPRDGAHVVCAVDQRNDPAMRLYERAGFRAFASRTALVRPV
jgi:ribosomal protein S18 acetylase RimI-like enzyme